MKCRHLFEKRVYLLSNRAVAGNALFTSIKEQQKFLGKVEQYLSPLCKVLAHSLHDDQFQLLIETKSRAQFVKFFKNTHKGKTNEKNFIPLSTYIFSRQMSNLQVSVAKKFNFQHERNGALFASRFERILIESKAEMLEWVNKLSRKKRYFKNAKKWAKQIMGISGKKLEPIGSKAGYDLMLKYKNRWLAGPEGIVNSNLVEPFRLPLIIDHLSPFLRKTMIAHRIKYPCGPNYN